LGETRLRVKNNLNSPLPEKKVISSKNDGECEKEMKSTREGQKEKIDDGEKGNAM